MVQEAGLARQCTAFWGDQQIEYYEIIELANWFAYSLHAPRAAGGTIIGRVVADIFIDIQCTYSNEATWRTSSPIVNSFVELYPEEKQSYVDLLFSARSLQVTDQRDIVYSSLGSPLALGLDGELMVEPDYTEPLPDLQVRAARALLRSPRDAPHVLLRVTHDAEEELDGDRAVPTWVPRWVTAPASAPAPASGAGDEPLPIPLTYSYEHRQAPYRASRGSPPFGARAGPGGAITVPGLVFDTLAWTSLLLRARNLVSDVRRWEPRFRDARVSAIEEVWSELLGQAGEGGKGGPERLASAAALALARGRPRSPRYADDFLAYCEHLRSLAGSPGASPFPPPPGRGAASEGEWAAARCRDRRLARTAGERLGLAPHLARAGDVCCVVRGVDVPVVLRPTARGAYRLVGEAYVNGVMDGELMGPAGGGPPEWKSIRIE